MNCLVRKIYQCNCYIIESCVYHVMNSNTVWCNSNLVENIDLSVKKWYYSGEDRNI